MLLKTTPSQSRIGMRDKTETGKADHEVLIHVQFDIVDPAGDLLRAYKGGTIK